jgi:2'-5' RNA ligase
MTLEKGMRMFEEVRDHWTWRPGWRLGRSFYTWHITFAEQPAAVALAAGYQEVIGGMPGITPVPPQWLHLTMQGVGFTDRVPLPDLDGIVEAARARVRALPSFTVKLGPAVVDPETIQLPVTPADQLQILRNTLRTAIADIWGPNSVPELPELRPHVSLGYWNARGPAAPLRTRLAETAEHTATMPITAISLINLNRDHQMYEWTTVATCTLG